MRRAVREHALSTFRDLYLLAEAAEFFVLFFEVGDPIGPLVGNWMAGRFTIG